MKPSFKPLLFYIIFLLAPQHLSAYSVPGLNDPSKEKDSAPQISYSFNKVAPYIVTVTCESERGKSSGSGFIAMMDEKPYLFTNQHVIMGAEKITFKTATGYTLKPRGVELSTTRDIARLPLSAETAGLSVSKNMSIGAPICVFGNSEGGGVATELYGKITGIGADIVEVSADFVSGNSGSPVLNINREVIGIASYVSWKNDDEDGSETRRFCYRLMGNQWESVNWKKYNDKYGKLYRDNEALVDSIFEIISLWANSPLSHIDADNHPDLDLRKWTTEHNHMVDRFNDLRDKRRVSYSEYNNFKRHLIRELLDSTESLSEICRNRARKMQFLAEQRELSGFLRENFKELAERLEKAALQFDNIRTEITKS